MTRPAGLPDGLLVSVRSAEEAVEAVAGGAAIVDVKEPARGPLGCATEEMAAAIVKAVDARVPCTLACGELVDGHEAIAAHVQRVATITIGGCPGIAAVKAGPAGLDAAAWREAFCRLVAGMPPGVELVAVAYADFQAAGSPDPADLIMAAVDVAATTLLIDTFDKQGAGLYRLAGGKAVGGWVAMAREAGLSVALAGQLTAAEIAAATASGARIVGVRSAACDGGRMGRVQRRNVGQLVGTLSFARGHPGHAIPGVSP
jgi:uncharacterized protein (UPF0264 family)